MDTNIFHSAMEDIGVSLTQIYLYSWTATCGAWKIPSRIALVRRWPLCTSFDSRRIDELQDKVSINPEERPFSQVTWLQYHDKYPSK